jgi:hypothetical protein
MVGKRRLMKATLGVATATRIAERVPEGAIIEIRVEPEESSRLIDVIWEGRPMMMFMRDLLDRGEELLDDADDWPGDDERQSAPR